ncbi:MAG: CehA/McbA family metallohydrolase [Candidatus Omnitrophota bacterium]|nr:CehA/McbA family metallohydrolase [Candidatus Omnitrophota bacterium]
MLKYCRSLPIVLLLLFAFGCPLQAEELRWFKGNLHAHTNRSDGDASPADVIRWYLEHEYDFLAITDHNVVASIRGIVEKDGRRLLVIPGQEVTSGMIHITALNVSGEIPSGLELMADEVTEYVTEHFRTKGLNEPRALGFSLLSQELKVIEGVVDAINAQGGLAVLCHPVMSFDVEHLVQAKGVRFIEIWNANVDGMYSVYSKWKKVPLTGISTTYRMPTRGSAEYRWSQALDEGKRYYGIAVDDAHHFSGSGALAGGGWIYVRARELSWPALKESLENGDFYATTGIIFKELSVTAEGEVTVEIAPEPKRTYTIKFISHGNKVVKSVSGTRGSYTAREEDVYVRVRADGGVNHMAWTQPVYYEGINPKEIA